MDHGYTVKCISQAISRLYAYNPNDSRARWAYERWTRFIASPEYRLAPDLALVPVLRSFAAIVQELRRTLPNVPTGTNAEVRLELLFAEQARRSIDDLEQAADQLVEKLGQIVAKVTAPSIVPLALIVAGLFFWMKSR